MGTLVAMLAGFFIGGGDPAPEPAPEQDDDAAVVQSVSYQTTVEVSSAEQPDPEPADDPVRQASPDSETWLGEIQLPGATLDFSITIEPTDDGWTGAIDIPAQHVAGLELRDIRRDGSVLAFGAALPGLPEVNWPRWELVISEDQSGADGLLKQSGQQFPTTMRRGDGSDIRLNRPQHPTGRLPYRTTEITVPVRTEAGAHTLAGTLSLPDADAFGEGPYPTAVLITGSGPQDRDETLMGHKPFLVVADHLARQGIASLRCDDRGVGGSTGSFGGATTLDFADDVRAQVELLEQRAEVGSIGLIGHSEGGLIAPIVAADTADVEWLVLLAAPGVSGREILAAQLPAMLRAQGTSDEALLAEMVEAQQRSFDAVLQGDLESAERELAGLVARQWKASGLDPDADRAGVEQAAAEQLAPLTSAWFKTFLTLDPREALAEVRQPVLVLNGTLDTQVLHDQNVPEILDALAESGNDAVTVHVLEGLNHLFQPASTGGLSEYGQIETTFDDAALRIISSWIAGLDHARR